MALAREIAAIAPMSWKQKIKVKFRCSDQLKAYSYRNNNCDYSENSFYHNEPRWQVLKTSKYIIASNAPLVSRFAFARVRKLVRHSRHVDPLPRVVNATTPKLRFPSIKKSSRIICRNILFSAQDPRLSLRQGLLPLKWGTSPWLSS